ncbi:hypothetical protein KFK09_014613 [Dendrobium nobile]|uniref:Uncharacterized protein n=1 Tax=Dendrobium nobile TaxID=94219 RepID=A0A8T3B3L8_DENNO|nr:hypothetical protein KFK09_014613 [Dendrobium nobile]
MFDGKNVGEDCGRNNGIECRGEVLVDQDPGIVAVVDNLAETTPPVSDLVVQATMANPMSDVVVFNSNTVDIIPPPLRFFLPLWVLLSVTSPVLSNVRVMGPFVEVHINLISPQALFARVGEEIFVVAIYRLRAMMWLGLTYSKPRRVATVVYFFPFAFTFYLVVTLLEYLNIPENEYGLVFTVSRGSALKLLSESYPFQTNKKLLTMFDHESQFVIWIAQRAREMVAKTYNASFKWPSLKVYNSELRKLISSKKRDSAAGLFYPYQWMAMEQQNNWHVLLDVGALGPKDMDSLGLSLYRPGFIITSFYSVFGSDPTGFGCLLIKKLIIGCLQNPNGGTGSGMVRISPIFPQYLSDSVDGLAGFDATEKECQVSQMPAFSGAFTSTQVRNVVETEIDQNNSFERDGASTIFEETESVSVGELMKSPILSEDEPSDYSLWIDLGHNPFRSENSGRINGGNLPSPISPSWFSGRKNHKRLSPKVTSMKKSMYEDQVLSFDATILSVSHESKEEPNIGIAGGEARNISFANGGKTNNSTSAIGIQNLYENDSTSEICQEGIMEMKESAIRRETECEFRLLERREGNNTQFNGGRFFGMEDKEHVHVVSMDRRVSFIMEDAKPTETFTHNLGDDDASSGGDYEEDDEDWGRREPEIICRHIDHLDGKEGMPLVRIYGPKIKYKRGAAVAFNVKDRGGGMIHPEIVQKLAETNGITLGIGFLSHIRLMDNHKALHGAVEVKDPSLCMQISSGKNATINVVVVTASLGFLTNFVDVYKMWAFLARFIDPVFVESVNLSAIDDIS